ncbi:MAG: deoxyribonuclease IV [Clostridiaceae bacterium]
MINQPRAIQETIKKKRTELTIGSHLSSCGGFMKMVGDMDAIGGDTFQYFSRNPRGSQKKKEDPKDIEAFLKIKQDRSLGPILAHAPYTLNPASADERIRDFAQLVLAQDIKSMELIPGNFYNFHPGSHVGRGVDQGILSIIQSLNQITDQPLTTKILLETMAGKGTEIGRNFEELARIIAGVTNQATLGVCLDTCHVYDAGYDIVNDLDGVLAEFDGIIGLDKLYAIHLNDSKNPFASHKDRHEKIGEGSLGLEAITRIINHPKLRNKPFFLETPNELEGYANEIRLLKGLRT